MWYVFVIIVTLAVIFIGRRGRSVNVATSGERRGSFLDQEFKRTQGDWVLWGSIVDRFAGRGFESAVVQSKLNFVGNDYYQPRFNREHHFSVDVTVDGVTDQFTFFMCVPEASTALGFKIGPFTWSKFNVFSSGLKPVRPNGRKRIKTPRQLRAHFAQLDK